MSDPLENCCMSLDVLEHYNINFLVVTQYETTFMLNFVKINQDINM
jgi:hypothetical protein